ncbi:cbb3-type cytochrome c oxidase subunit II, partial [Leptospira santarosai]
DTSPGSMMPAYPWLFDAELDAEEIVNRMKGLSKVGVPYTEADYLSAPKELEGKTEGDALIVYLLKLGKDTATLSKSIR